MEKFIQLVTKWIQHPSRQSVTGDTVYGTWRIHNERYTGLTSILQKWFHEGRFYQTYISKKKSKCTKKNRFFNNRQNGTRIHHELGLLSRGERHVKSTHCVVKRTWKYFIEELKWIPITSEYKVWDSERKATTAIDLLFYCPKRKKMIAVEIKTGYDTNEYCSTHGTLQKYGFVIEKSIAHGHQLQIAYSCMMLERSHPGLFIGNADMFVARIPMTYTPKKPVVLYPVESSVYTFAQGTYDQLLDHISSKKQRKKNRNKK